MTTDTGQRTIYWRGIELVINDRVLVPRPETELLVLEAMYLESGKWVHEVGTGSGAVALAIKRERSDLAVTASDIDPHALEVAEANANRLDLDVNFFQGPGLHPLEENRTRDADLIVANLPYLSDVALAKRPPEVAEEPKLATQGECGADGLGEIRQLVHETPEGWKLALEHDTHHGHAVRGMLLDAETRRDQTGHERMTVGISPA